MSVQIVSSGYSVPDFSLFIHVEIDGELAEDGHKIPDAAIKRYFDRQKGIGKPAIVMIELGKEEETPVEVLGTAIEHILSCADSELEVKVFVALQSAKRRSAPGKD